jgi:acetyl esterase
MVDVKDLLENRPQPDRRIPYKRLGETLLSLHLFLPPDYSEGDSRPAIVFFFGGGWKGGTPNQFSPQASYLASRGMVAISAEYRTENDHGTTPAECVADGKSAIRFVRSHAKKLGIDPDRIAAGGGSAGAHIAAATATVEGFIEDDEILSVSCRPNALVLFNPVFDNGPGGYGHDRVKDYWEAFSPLHNLSDKTPPAVIFLGDNDDLIPVSTAERFRDIMRSFGNRCDLHIYADQKHGFFNQSRFAETLLETDNFLTSMGYLA